VPPQDVFEGWYLGGTIGGATVNYDFAPANGSIDTSGILGGVIGGWSWQSGPIVFGIEGDFLGADASGSRHFNAGSNQVSPNIDAMADLRLRAGYAITPRVLLFGTFGGAWANADLTSPASAAAPVTPTSSAGASAAAPRSRSVPSGARASTISSPISAPRR
jgi:outer membrane immunogenic protein